MDKITKQQARGVEQLTSVQLSTRVDDLLAKAKGGTVLSDVDIAEIQDIARHITQPGTAPKSK